jgi:acyl carrier protein
VDLIRRHLAEILRFESPQQIDRRRRFMELGVDSLIAIEFRQRLQSALRIHQPLSATLVFDYPTVEALAEYLEQDVLGMQTDRESSQVNISEMEIEMSRRVDEVAKLDESDVEALLLAKLQGL